MSAKTPKNVPASIRQRLLDRAKRDGRPFGEVLQYYAMERFLYRLSRSPHASHYILKGALMRRAWRSPEIRPTMDIDMLGRTSNGEANVVAHMREILAVKVDPDGLIFDTGSIGTEAITEDADYERIRVRFVGRLDSARIHMQIDIGFGDVVFPGPEKIELPTILDSAAPRLFCYTRESAIAEKFEAMVKLGELNSRMKDFYDIWLLSRQFDIDGNNLADAIRRTFDRRGTPIPAEVIAHHDRFIDAKQPQWVAFRARLQQDSVPTSFAVVATAVERFLGPVITAIQQGTQMSARWSPSGPWI